MSANPAQFGSAVILALNPNGLGFITPRPAFLSNSAAAFQAAYFDTNGNPFVPTSVTYQIDDIVSGNEILPPTELNAAAGNLIVITAAQNAMISLSRASEAHVMTLNITSPLGIGTIDTTNVTIDQTLPLSGGTGTAVYRRRVIFDIVRDPPVV